MSVAVVRFPGSNCEGDTLKAVRTLTGESAVEVWHKDRLPGGVRLVVLPGGFSYGDYLRSGAIARFSPVMESVVEFARAGGAVLGICNGFQILLESGLLPGAMLRNRDVHFVCKWVHLKVERPGTRWTDFDQRVLRIPIAHGEGNWYADAATVAEVEANGQVLLRYCDAQGHVAQDANPNGSLNSIAGLCNREGNVFGLMPHPERALDGDLGGTDGRWMWASILRSLGIRVLEMAA